MSDNAKCHTGQLFARTLTELGARHIRIPPYTPRWNGKVCVFASRCHPVRWRGSPHLLV
jgi:transposase InsO family protein